VPTILRSGPYRLYFHSHEAKEPRHVHVDRDDATAKFWLEPLSLASSLGYKPHELTRLRRLVVQYQKELADAWNAFHP
jgi:hypothetical protein